MLQKNSRRSIIHVGGHGCQKLSLESKLSRSIAVPTRAFGVESCRFLALGELSFLIYRIISHNWKQRAVFVLGNIIKIEAN